MFLQFQCFPMIRRARVIVCVSFRNRACVTVTVLYRVRVSWFLTPHLALRGTDLGTFRTTRTASLRLGPRPPSRGGALCSVFPVRVPPSFGLRAPTVEGRARAARGRSFLKSDLCMNNTQHVHEKTCADAD